jgi:hypothetical protein
VLRKRLTILAVAAMLLASVGVFSAPALADVHPNAHNCAGFISTIAPEDVNHTTSRAPISVRSLRRTTGNWVPFRENKPPRNLATVEPPALRLISRDR